MADEIVSLATLGKDAERLASVSTWPFGIEDGAPHLVGVNELLVGNAKTLAALRAYELTGSDEERVTNKKFLAAARKYKKNFQTAAKTYRKGVLEAFDDEVATVTSGMDEIIDLADQRNVDIEKKFHDTRHDTLVSVFSNIALLDEKLDGLDADRFIDSHLLNRSVKEADAVNEVQRRVTAYEMALDGGMMGDATSDEVLGLLSAANWDLVGAISAHKEMLRAKKEAADAAELARQRREQEERERELARRERELAERERAAERAKQVAEESRRAQHISRAVIEIPDSQRPAFARLVADSGLDVKLTWE